MAGNDELNQLWGAGGTEWQNTQGAPAGLPQAQRQSEMGLGKQGNLQELAQGWFGGRNLQGTENGYNTPFYEEMFKQEQEAADSGNVRGRWDRADKTGIVTFDQDGMKYGDVFNKGQYVGNLVQMYGSAATDTMMSQLYWSATEQAEKFKDPSQLHEAVQEERKNREFQWESGAGAEAFQSDVDKRIDDIQDTAADEVMGIGGGAVGGAVIGGGIGAFFGGIGAVPGALIGGALGAIGGWLNRDEATAALARGQERAEIAEQKGLGAGVQLSEYLKTAGELGMKAISPTTNLLHGSYDLAQGGTGNNEQAWYTVDPKTGERERAGIWTVADVAAGFTDAALQFSSAPARAIFQATMGTTIAGGVGELVLSGGQSFDDRRGDFDKIYEDDRGNFTPGALAAGIGNIAIDALQMGAARGFGQLASAGTGREAAELLPKWMDPLRNRGYRLDKGKTRADIASTSEITGGFRYARDAQRNIIGRRMTTTILAPSEAVRALAPRVMGLRQKAMEYGAVTYDDLFRASARLDDSSMAMKMMLVNGFGEGAEEGAQAILEPLSHDYRPDPREVFESMVMGFAMGAGMGAATRIQQSANRSLSAVNAMRVSAGLAPFTRAEWNRLSAEERQEIYDAIPPASRVFATDEARRLQDAADMTAAASVPALQWMIDSYNQSVEAEAMRGSRRVDDPFTIGEFTVQFAPNAGAMSMQSVQHVLENMHAGRTIQLEGAVEIDAGTRSLIGASQKVLERVIEQVREANARFEQATEDQQRALVQTINGVLEQHFNSKDRAEAYAVTMLASRDPQQTSSSWVALMPQVSEIYTRDSAHAALLVSNQVIQAVGGDFDGDQFRDQNLVVMTDEVFRNARSGVWRFGAAQTEGDTTEERDASIPGTVSLFTSKAEKNLARIVQLATEAGANDTGALGRAFGFKETMLRSIEADLRELLVDRKNGGRLRERDLQRAFTQFKADIESGNGEARNRLITNLWTDNGSLMLDWGREELRDFPLEISRIVSGNLEEFRSRYAQTRPSASPVKGSPIELYELTETEVKRVGARMVTEGQEMARVLRGWTDFRDAQVKYNSRESKVDRIEEADRGDATAWISRMFRIAAGKPQTELEIVRNQDSITRRVNEQLSSIANKLVEDSNGSLAYSEAIAVASAQQVPQVRGGRFTGAYVSMSQLLLQQAVEDARKIARSTIDQDPALQAKLTKLESYAEHGESRGGTQNASLATAEIFGGQQLFDILGNQTGYLRPEMSIEQTVQWLTRMPQTSRTFVVNHLKNHPLYGERKDGKGAPFLIDDDVTGYRVMVDAITDIANHRLSKTESGQATGEFAAQSGRFIDAAEGIVRQTLGALESLAMNGWKVSKTRDGLREFFDQTPQQSRLAMEMLDPEIAPFVVTVLEEDGKAVPRMAGWFYDLFDGRSPEAAVAELWRQTKLAKWKRFLAVDFDATDLPGSYAKIKDRTVQLMFTLQRDEGPDAYRQFWNDVSAVQDVRDIEKVINTKYRPGGAPTVAFADDVEMFSEEINGVGGAVNSTSVRLESMTKAVKAMERVSTTVAKDAASARADLNFWQNIDAELKALDSNSTVTNDTSAGYLSMLETALARARRYGVNQGSNLILDSVFASIRGIADHLTDKGSGPLAHERNGQADRIGNLPGTNAPIMQQLQQMTALDMVDARVNPSLLARQAIDFLTEDGQPLTWDALDARALNKLAAAGAEGRALLRMILAPMAVDMASEEATSLFFIGTTSVADIVVEGGPWKTALRDINDDLSASDASNMTLFSLLSGAMMHKQHERSELKAITALGILRTAGLHDSIIGRPDLQEGLAHDAVSDIAPILRQIGIHAAQQLKSGGKVNEQFFLEQLDVVRKEARAARSGRLAERLGFQASEAQELFETSIDLWSEARIEQANVEYTGDALALVEEDIRDRKELFEAIFKDNRLEALLHTFALTKKEVDADTSGTATLPTKKMLTSFIRTNQHIKVRAMWALPEIREVLEPEFGVDAHGMPKLTAEQWEKLSQAVIATRLDEAVTNTSFDRIVPPFAGFDEGLTRALWQDSGELVAELLLNPEYGIPQAMGQMTLDASVEVGNPGTDDLPHMFKSRVFNEALGAPTTETKNAIISAFERIDARSAGSAIGMIGNAPKDYIVLDHAMKRTWDLPPEEAWSTASLTWDMLQADDQATTFLSSHTTRPVRLRELNGRWARGGRVFFRTTAGDEIPAEDLFALTVGNARNTTPSFGRRDSRVPAGHDLRAISPWHVRHAVNAAIAKLQEQGITVDPASARVELDYIHVDSKPADTPGTTSWANNAFFDGLNFTETGADVYSSAVGALFASQGGVSQRGQEFALQANKKGRQALVVAEGMDRETRDQLTSGWQADLSGAIHNLTNWAMAHNPGDGLMADTFYLSLYKILEARHIVRAVLRNPDGTPGDAVAYSARDFIAHQRAGTLPELAQAELVRIPEKALNRILGLERVVQVDGAGTLSFQLDLIEPWGGTGAEYEAQMPGLLRREDNDWHRPSLLDTSLAKIAMAAPSRMSVRMRPSDASKYAQDITRSELERNGVYAERLDSSGFRRAQAEALPKLQQALIDAVKAADYQAAFKLSATSTYQMRFQHSLLTGERAAKAYLESFAQNDAENKAIFLYDPFGHADAINGTYTQAYLKQAFNDKLPKKERPYKAVRGDGMILDASLFASSGLSEQEQLAAARRAVDMLTQMGVTLVVVPGKGDRFTSELAGQIKQMITAKTGYERLDGTSNLFAPLERERVFANEQSRLEDLVSATTISPTDLVIDFISLSPSNETSENSYLTNSLRSGIVEQNNIARFDAATGFNLPTRDDQREAGADVVRKLFSTDEGRAHVVALSRMAWEQERKVGRGRTSRSAQFDLDTEWTKIEEDLRRDMREALENGALDPSIAKMPWKVGAEVRIGSFRVLMDQNNRILLWRSGQSKPDEALRAKMFEQPYGAGPGNIAVYTPTPDNALTTYEGTYFGEDAIAAGGTRVHLRTALSAHNAKMIQDENAMKYLVNVNPERWEALKLPETIWKSGRSNDGWVEWEGTESKQAVRGAKLNYRTAFALYGADFRGDLVDAVGLSSKPYDQLDADAKVAAWNDTVTALKRLTRNHSLSISEADALIRGAYDPQAAQQMFPDFELLPGLAGAGKASTRMDLLNSSQHRNLTPQQRILFATVTYMMTPGASLDDIVYTGGLTSTSGFAGSRVAAIEMPSLFTQYFDLASSEKDSRLHEMMRSRFQGVFADHVPIDPGARAAGAVATMSGVTVMNDLSLQIVGRDGQVHDVIPRYTRMRAGMNNPTLNETATRGKDTQGLTPHAQDIAALALSTKVAYSRDIEKKWRRAEGAAMRLTAEDQGEILANAIDYHTRLAYRKEFPTATRPTSSGLVYDADAHEQAVAYRQIIDVKAAKKRAKQEGGYSDEDLARVANEYAQRHKELQVALNIPDNRAFLVDYLIRMWLGKPGGAKGDAMVSLPLATRALAVMTTSVKQRGELPLAGSMLPFMDASDLYFLYTEAMKDGGTKWLREDGEPVTEWEDWVKIAFGTAMDSQTPVLEIYLTALDGVMHTYRDSGYLTGKPLSTAFLRQFKILNPTTNQMVHSMFEGREALVTMPVFLGEGKQALALALNDETLGGQTSDSVALREELLEERLSAAEKWSEKRTAQAPEVRRSVATARREGSRHMTEMSAGHAISRGLLNISFFNRVANPKLLISSFFEYGQNSLYESAFRTLTGTSLGVGARGAARVAVSQGNEGQRIGLRYSAKQVVALGDLAYELGGDKAAVNAIVRDVIFTPPHIGEAGRIEKATHTLAKTASWFASPTRGMRGQAIMQRYLEAVMDYQYSTGEYNVPVEVLVEQMKRDSDFIRKHMPHAHMAGERVVGNMFSMAKTVPGYFVDRAVNLVAGSGNAGVANLAGTPLKMATQFSNFFFNAGIRILGLQAANQAVAVALHGRLTPKAWLRTKFRDKPFQMDEKGQINFDELIDSADLTDAVIRSGISHSSLFALGLMAGGMGLTGEDEEDKRRRRAAQFVGASYLYDPRKVQNDFRNAGAIYLDSLPPFLSTLFYDKGTDRSMAEMNWVMRQFLSPMMGMARYFDTGNAQELVWGFTDAIGAMPVVNTTMFYDAVNTFNILNQKAEEAAPNGADGAGAAQNFLMTAVGSFERMLMENAFINEIYTGWDAYDRDPWALPAVDDKGNILRNKLGVPTPTSALQDWVDEEGNVQQGYVNRDGMDALFHNWSEKRLGFALMASMFDGFSGAPDGFFKSDFLRQNMSVKTRSIEKPGLDIDQAKSLVLSIWDQETDSELLTLEGAKAIFRGLEKGSVKLGDPALENLYIPIEMRKEIEAEWRVNLVAEGIDMGLTSYEAEDRMEALWYGPRDRPDIPGLRSILYSDQISATKSTEYYQLNTTYVMGPDGLPWATGVSRNVFHNAFGFSPLQRYGVEGGLPTDSRLNSVDAGRGINTGLRALQKVDESWEIPDDEELNKRITDAIEDLKGSLGSATSGGYNGYGYGGGRGSGGSYTRLYAIPRNEIAYGNSIPNIRTNDPIIRRANIQRQRFSSERGRLKSWQ